MNTPFLKQTLIFAGVVFLFLVLVNVLNISYPITVTSTTKSTELAVVGEGKVEVVPDSADINVGASLSDVPTVEQAQTQLNKINNDIIAAMKALGIDAKQIKTSNYSVYPNYDYEGNRTITGYSADVQITITAKDISKVADIVQAATKAGANNIYGTSFSISDPAKYREEARNKAIANAKAQAKNIADSLGIKLGKVTNIVETSPSGDTPVMYEKAMMSASAGAGGGPSMEAGSQELSSTVTLYFEKR